jgi:hypothetical protein
MQEGMTTLIRRLGKGYCAAGDGFYCFDEDLSRVLQRVAEFTRRLDSEGRLAEAESATPAAPAEADARET